MTRQRKLGAAIALVPAISAAIGLIAGALRTTSAVGAAMVGIIIGTAVARGRFSTTPEATKRN